ARNAARRGAIGILLYTDPIDDGYFKGDVYPRGPYRPLSGIQRGSILDLTVHPGDPLTPGWPARDDAQRIQPDESDALPTIPCVPISAEAARPLLESLAGDNVPSGWQGALPFAYHVGPGPTEVSMKVAMKLEQRPIANVVARLEGSDFPEQMIVLGGHLDSWTHGAVDNGSGSTALIEMARALGEAARQGHRPRRTIVVCLWDGEEFGIIGSTEFVEARLEDLRQNAVAYINLDAAVSGSRFGGSGTPSLKGLLRGATRSVPEPLQGGTIYDGWSGGRGEPAVGDLGSGSDYAAFLQHAGIPAVHFGFSGPNGNYHSMYDTFEWMSRFGDPTFHYHATLAGIAGVAALRLANADLLPIDGAAAVRRVATEAELLATRYSGLPVDELLKEARAVAELVSKQCSGLESRVQRGDLSADELTATNAALMRVERHFTSESGLFGRPWYRHLIFAPDPKLGYGGQTLPGLREAAEASDRDRARVELERLMNALRLIRRDFEQLDIS
ncbi:MAG: M28 family peptidase, partial [Planctomycetota bacterium]